MTIEPATEPRGRGAHLRSLLGPLLIAALCAADVGAQSTSGAPSSEAEDSATPESPAGTGEASSGATVPPPPPDDSPPPAPAPPPEEDSGPIELTEGWTLDLGGQFRYRYMDETNRALNGSSPTRDRFHLWRTRVHADVRSEDGFRAFVELRDARISGNSRPPLAIDRDDLDLLNAWVQLDIGDQFVRAGRTELLEGKERLISPLDWSNTRRTFDGALVRHDWEDAGHTDIFLTRPVTIDVHSSNPRITDRWFSGVYHSGRLEEHARWDVFALALNDTDNIFAAEDGSFGDQDLYTVGGRWQDEVGALDYELWYARQFGHFAGDTVRAFAWSARVGVTAEDAPGSPRLGLDVDMASGDDDPTDGTQGTFNQLFPLGHAWLGYFDLVGRQNIFAVSPSVTADLDENTVLRVAWHDFRLAQAEDALYNPGGGASFADPTGAAGRDVGQELDLRVNHKLTWLEQSSLVVGYSHFDPGDRISDLGGDGDADLFYVQFLINF